MGAKCCSLDKAPPSGLAPEEELKAFHRFVHDKLLANKHSHNALKDAFLALGGGDDGKVQRSEMTEKLKALQYPGSPDTLFDLIDADNQGYITQEEFKATTAKDFIEKGPLREFKRFILKEYENLDEAFNQLDSG